LLTPVPHAGATLPLFPGSSQASALSVADSGEAGLAPAPAPLMLPAATLEQPAAELVPKPADPVAPKPLPAAVVPKAPAPHPTLGPLRDSRGPATLTQQALDVVARLRVQLAAADAERLAATDEASKAVAAAKARYIRQQLSAVQGGFIDASQLALPAGSPAGPVCAAKAMQCGGLEPGSNTVLWKGPSECCGANGTLTCVQTDPAFATCVPVEESRAKGCSALNAKCGGDFWAGPFCCAAGQGCLWQSQALSTCKLCPKLYEQWCVHASCLEETGGACPLSLLTRAPSQRWQRPHHRPEVGQAFLLPRGELLQAAERGLFAVQAKRLVALRSSRTDVCVH